MEGFLIWPGWCRCHHFWPLWPSSCSSTRNKTVSAYTAIGGAAISWLLGWPIAFTVFSTEHFGEHPFFGTLFTIPTGTTEIVIGYQVDPANALDALHVDLPDADDLHLFQRLHDLSRSSDARRIIRRAYAQHKDPRYSRFMAYISLFATGMFGLVVSNSLITFFIFWEIMGLCSYLLIGFWYEKAVGKGRIHQGVYDDTRR